MKVPVITSDTVAQLKQETESVGYTKWAARIGESLIMSGKDHLGMFIAENLDGSGDQGKTAYAGYAVFRMLQIQCPELTAVSEENVRRVQQKYALAPHEEAILVVDRLLKGGNPEVGKFILFFSSQLEDEQLTFVAAFAYEMCMWQLESMAESP